MNPLYSFSDARPLPRQRAALGLLSAPAECRLVRVALWSIALGLAGGAVGSAHGADPVITKIFGPESAGGQYKHPASFTELHGGDFFLVFYGGEGEYKGDTAVYGARRVDETGEWQEPRKIADTPNRSEGNAVVWQAPDGRVWLYYVTRYGATWSTSRIKVRFSDDGAASWSDSYLLSLEAGLMVRGRPIVLAEGSYLLPVYHETGHDTESVGPDSTSLFFRYDPKAKTWTESARIWSRIGNIQPSVVELEPGKLLAYSRRGGGYDGRPDGRIVRATSNDGGRTWSRGEDSRFRNPNAAIDFVRLRNGHLVLAYNDSVDDRTPLTLAVSTDNDKTYTKRHLVEGPGPYAYPTIVQTADDRIHVTFTTDDRTVVRHAVLEESWILAGEN